VVLLLSNPGELSKLFANEANEPRSIGEFFSIIRRRGGYDRDPTAFSFKNNMRHIFLSNLRSANINGSVRPKIRFRPVSAENKSFGEVSVSAKNWPNFRLHPKLFFVASRSLLI
jgi:hypothetical protein